MSDFSVDIATAVEVATFSFTRILTTEGAKYHVSGSSADGKTYFFSMESKGAAWRIINAPKVPDWILEVEVALSNAILQHFPQD